MSVSIIDDLMQVDHTMHNHTKFLILDLAVKAK